MKQEVGFSKRYRRTRRLETVTRVIVRQGFGYLLDQLGLRVPRGAGNGHPLSSRGDRIRHGLEELGPTFVKMGQMLSTRADLVPEDIRSELAKLQDRVPPFPFEQARSLVERELGRPLSEVFPRFDPVPLAAASIAQVHRARLVSGEEVVVKVQRPGIRDVVSVDLDILYDLAQLAQRHTTWGELYGVVDLVEEFRRTLLKEMDFLAEGQNAERFRRNFTGDASVHIPKIYWHYSTSKVLTMEYIPGVNIRDADMLRRQNMNPSRIASNLSQVILQQILVHGFFHADPHPGNIAVLPGEIIVLMDFGMVGRLTRERRRQLIRLVLGLVRGNSGQIVQALEDISIIGPEVDIAALRHDVARLREHYYEVPFGRMKLGEPIREIMTLAFKYHIPVPAEFSLVAKALITLEGIVEELDPDLSVVKLAEPLAKRLVRESLWKEGAWKQFADAFVQFPGRIDRILQKVEDGHLTIRLEHAELKEALSRLDRITNRLSLSLILLASSIVIAGLVMASAMGSRLPFLEIVLGVALLMAVWLLAAIVRSGRF